MLSLDDKRGILDVKSRVITIPKHLGTSLIWFNSETVTQNPKVTSGKLCNKKAQGTRVHGQPRTKYHVNRQTCIYNMAVSCHPGFYRTTNSAIRSTDSENPSLEQTNNGSDAPFARYLPNYTVTLKPGFGITQGHRKWHHSIEHIQRYIHLL